MTLFFGIFLTEIFFEQEETRESQKKTVRMLFNIIPSIIFNVILLLKRLIGSRW